MNPSNYLEVGEGGGGGGEDSHLPLLYSLFNLMADGMFSGMRLGQENQLRIHQNES